MKTNGLIAAIILIVAATAATAEGHERPHPQINFSDVDENDDALISRDELEAFMLQMRERRSKARRLRPEGFSPVDIADEDGDGYLNEDEFATLKARMRERMRERHDRQSDGADDDEA